MEAYCCIKIDGSLLLYSDCWKCAVVLRLMEVCCCIKIDGSVLLWIGIEVFIRCGLPSMAELAFIRILELVVVSTIEGGTPLSGSPLWHSTLPLLYKLRLLLQFFLRTLK